MALKIFTRIASTFFALILGWASATVAQDALITVSFTNKSSNTLHCGMLSNGEYFPFLLLEGKTEKRFDEFASGAKLRCQIDLAKNSYTILTYFEVKTPGAYEFLLEKVPCTGCRTAGEWRWATIVVDPHGKADYLHVYDQPKAISPAPSLTWSSATTVGQLSSDCRALLSNCGQYNCVMVRTTKTSTCIGDCVRKFVDRLSAANISARMTAADADASAACIGFRADLGGTKAGAECLAGILGAPYRIGNCIADGYRYNLKLE
ncbi:hypothetical protein [uncultured Thiodictyon sp.]|uniref:hypothetical protein n=1 Tax=uncultured Thiodictyon sp. TaxID=1846217 RepID=UPI0025FC31AB|nr:hypothetical protein [uncultured Thiodictyon sp.]